LFLLLFLFLFVAYQKKKLFINECIIIFPTIYFPAIISAVYNSMTIPVQTIESPGQQQSYFSKYLFY